jgi:hypothetical protein
LLLLRLERITFALALEMDLAGKNTGQKAIRELSPE